MTDMMLQSGTGRLSGQDLCQRSPDQAVFVTSGYPNPDFETESPESHLYFVAKPYSKRTLCEKIEKIPAPISRPAKQASWQNPHNHVGTAVPAAAPFIILRSNRSTRYTLSSLNRS
jgi:hypothetical protein